MKRTVSRELAKRSADQLEGGEYDELVRRAKGAFVDLDKRRARPRQFKEEFVRSKGYKNLRLRSEEVAAFEYRPTACRKSYRVVVVRKNITVERGETALFDEVRYFFYITNDHRMSVADVVFAANDRCDQENLIEQLKNGVHALHAPVNMLHANPSGGRDTREGFGTLVASGAALPFRPTPSGTGAPSSRPQG